MISLASRPEEFGVFLLFSEPVTIELFVFNYCQKQLLDSEPQVWKKLTLKIGPQVLLIEQLLYYFVHYFSFL